LQHPTIQAAPAPSLSSPSNVQIGVSFLVALLLYCVTQRAHLHDMWTEDVPVYARGVGNWLHGHTPYTGDQAPLYFLYPPAFLLLAGLFAHVVPAAWGTGVYIAVIVLALVALPLVLARYVFRQPWLGPWLALLVFFAWPQFAGIRAMHTMNIASLLYCLAFAASAPGLRGNRWTWFYLAVFLSCAVKVTFLALLLLPLLAGARQWWRSVLCGGAVIATNLAERLLLPDLYQGYEWSLRQGIVASQAFGYGVFGVLANYHFRQKGVGIAAYLVAGALALLLTGLMFFLRRQLLRAGKTPTDLAADGVWLAMVVSTTILVNPREMQYDMDVTVLAAFVLLVYGLRAERWLFQLMAATFLPSLLVPHLVTNPRLYGFYETALSLGAFALAYWRLARSARAASPATQPPLADGFKQPYGDAAQA